jgi:hypothetical protein
MSNSKSFLMEMIQKEVSSMAGGANAGSMGASKDDRKNEVQQLRSIIREICKSIITEKSEMNEEKELRQVIRKLISEVKKEVEDSPHESTAINLLEELLKQILPGVETDYKTLTTNPEQRESYRANLLDAVSKLLAAEDVNTYAVVDKGEESLEEIDIKIEDDDESLDFEPDSEKFIDIEDNVEVEEEPFGLEDQEETGRNMAARSYDNIEKNIVDSYSILNDKEDRKIFRDYLITNLKLYFDKYESELSTDITEPTTDAYEKEQNQLATDQVDAEMGI